ATRGLAGALVGRAAQDPWGLASRVVREFGHFWELYPTRLATDDPEQRRELHQSDPRLPLVVSFPIALRDWVSGLSFGSDIALAISGVAVAWRRQRSMTVLLVAVALTYALGFALFVAKLRYRIAILPCVMLLAGVGATAMTNAAVTAAARRRPR